MRLFTVGPVEMLDEIRELGGEMVPYFRTAEFSELMLDTDRLLKKQMGAEELAKGIYLTASGSAAMEAAVLNCFSTEDKLLIVNGGSFGQRFVDICRIHSLPYEEIKLAAAEEFTAEHLAKYNPADFTGFLVNIDETSTGQLYDIGLISDFCRRGNLYLVVDAISSFLCDEYEMAKYDIDVTIISSQKGLCVPPGMSVVMLSERITEERVKKSRYASLYFDFKNYLHNFERGQTPYTPAVGICVQMNRALHLVEKEGLANHLAHVQKVAVDFRSKAIEQLPVKLPAYPLSNAVTPLIFQQPIAYKVFETLKDEYDIFVNPTGGATHDTVLRVAHIGKTDTADNDMLLKYMKLAVAKICKKRKT